MVRRLPAFLLALIVGLLLICACQPTPTPLPANLPTLPPPSATPGLYTPTPMLMRYAIAPNALPYFSQQDRTLISASAQIIQLDAPPAVSDLGARYDLVVAVGDLTGGTPTPSPLQIDLVINTSVSPLNDPNLAQIVRSAVDPQKIAASLNLPGLQAAAEQPTDPTTLRNQLANAGYPDGFDLTLLAQPDQGAEALAQSLDALGIDTRLTMNADQNAQLSLTSQTESANSVPLYTLPISYAAVAGLKITFTPDGFPIAQRSG